ncbi:hypothetical protein ACIBO6_24140 [Streptomyces luteogriseus]|uniref:hypothetical protein n=1 Tax=Streptomyces luteogriseus TaxID=68233 RepID=UPI0037B3FBEC
MGFRTWYTRRRQPATGGNPEPRATPGTDTDLNLLYDQVQQLRALAEDPERARDADRVYDFSIRWGALLHGRLPRLTEYDRRGLLTPAQQQQFADLRTELGEVTPLAEELGLAVPPLNGER